MTTANSPASKEVVTAALLVIGSKILSGRTKDQNIGYIAQYLTALGIDLKEVRVVGDEERAIVDALNAVRHRCTYVFTTGGIGPTHGDITTGCVAKAFGVPIDADPRALAILHEWVKATGAEMNEARLRMTRIPKGAALVLNKVSGAPGFWIGNVIVMAGVPSIMQSYSECRSAFFLVYPCQYGARWCSRELAKVREPEACPFFEPPFTVQTIFRPEAPMPAYPRTKTESRWRSSALTELLVQPFRAFPGLSMSIRTPLALARAPESPSARGVRLLAPPLCRSSHLPPGGSHAGLPADKNGVPLAVQRSYTRRCATGWNRYTRERGQSPGPRGRQVSGQRRARGAGTPAFPLADQNDRSFHAPRPMARSIPHFPHLYI